MSRNRILINPNFVAIVLGGVTFLLLIASIATSIMSYVTSSTYIHKLSYLFFFDNEQNVPTCFSALLLLIASLVLAVITILEGKHTVSEAKYWAVLSAGFLFMSFDELVCLHERLIKPISTLLGGGNLGFLHFTWVIPGMLIVAVLACFFAGFLIRLHSKIRLTFITAAVIYLGGCIGLELVGGKYAELYTQQNPTYIVLATLEELMEMAGVILFIWGLLVFIADKYQEVQFQFSARRSRSTQQHQLPTED